MGWVVSTTPRPLYHRERPGTHCTGGWVGPRTDLDVCGKSRPHRDSIPVPSSPTALSRPGPPSSIKFSEIKSLLLKPNQISYPHYSANTTQYIIPPKPFFKPLFVTTPDYPLASWCCKNECDRSKFV